VIPIVDAHVHVWDLKTGLYPRRQALRDAGDRSIVDYMVENLLADAEGVALSKAVHVEAFPTDGLKEVRHVNALAEKAAARLPLAIVAYADLANPGIDETLAALAAFPRVRGIRHALSRPDQARDLLAEPAWRAGFALLHRHGLSFDLQLSPQQAPEMVRLLTAHPETPVVVNHLGWPKERSFAGWHAWRKGLGLLAALPNVSVKLSGVGMFEPDWTAESIRPYVFEAIDAFGPKRAMFASNFPVDRRWRSYPAVWQAYADVASSFPDAEKRALLGGNAERFYRM
jgi:predicted TIM-barrel fold metal-dependent hydrolase